MLQQEEMLALFPQDGTIRCVERLKSGSSCTDPKVRPLSTPACTADSRIRHPGTRPSAATRGA
eukprot:1175843-Prorocentrum_minimum.AAC.2